MTALNFSFNDTGIRSASLSLVVVFTILLSACGTKYSSTSRTPIPTDPAPVIVPDAPATSSRQPAPPEPQIIRPTTIAPPADQARSLPAALALRDQASSAAETGNHARAIGLLERAIRISPQDPLTFQALAQSHLAMNRPGQALQLVRRGLSLNPTPSQRESLELLAEKCRAQL